MSDISIPGISSNNGMNTRQMVEDLMEVERIPVRRLENQVETYETQRTVWQSMSRGLGSLRDASRTMYGFENPFRGRIASVSDPSILSATANRQAQEGIEEITILQTASNDRFGSRPVARDFRVPSGQYAFSVGDETRSLRFGGGSLRDFASVVNDRAGEIVNATVVPNTSDTHVLVIEGQQEGAAAQLSFGENTQALMEQIGVIAPARPENALALLEEEPLRLAPGQREDVRLDRRFTVEPGMVLRFEARISEADVEPWIPPETPPGPSLPDPGGVTLNDLTIRNDQLGLELPTPEVPTPPPVVEDNRVMTMLGAGMSQDLPPLPDSPTFRTVEIPSADLISTTDGFAFENRNTGRVVEIRNLEILDPTERGGARPQNALSTARDARIEYSGIEIVRSSNQIDDLIPGVTLDLRRASDQPVEVDVQPDRETAKDSIIELIGFYNQVVRDINIYTRTDEEIINQIEYFDEAEREMMQERLGIFQGDSSLNQLRSRMQTIMMDAYNSGGDSTYRMLAEIGISTNASGVGSGLDVSRMRGYLEISETRLDEALATDFEAVGRLFGQDTNGDLVVDTGAAVALERFVSPYVQTGGIIATRTGTIDTRIDQTQTRITRYNDRLEDYEQELRVDFGRMESMMQQIQDSGRALDRLNTDQGGN